MSSSFETYGSPDKVAADGILHDSNPSVSIVIPAYNAASYITRGLESILMQPKIDALQIIVVDDGSSDDTASIVKSYAPDVTLFRNDLNRGMSATWNFGIERAEGEIIVFIDQDCVAKNDWLTRLVHPFLAASDQRVVQGNFYLQYLDTLISRYHARWRRTVYLQKHTLHVEEGQIYLNTINTRNMAIHRDVLRELKQHYGNVFNEKNARGGGDLELGRRLHQMGVKILFEETAEVYHMDPVHFLALLDQKYRHAFFAAQAGFSERIFDAENFQRVVINPAKYGVPVWFSLPIWCISMYGFQKGLRSARKRRPILHSKDPTH